MEPRALLIKLGKPSITELHLQFKYHSLWKRWEKEIIYMRTKKDANSIC
jgi:hypothetical protein